MRAVMIIDRSGLRKLPVLQLNKMLHAVKTECKYLTNLVNSEGDEMAGDDVERNYRRIMELRKYIKNIENEIGDRDVG